MASTGVNVLRWSALGLGVFYGLYHQASISTRDRLTAIKRDWDTKESLITKAKSEYQRSQLSPEQKSSSGSSNPKEDLEYLQDSK